jgi:hypothetical protein
VRDTSFIAISVVRTPAQQERKSDLKQAWTEITLPAETFSEVKPSMSYCERIFGCSRNKKIPAPNGRCFFSS